MAVPQSEPSPGKCEVAYVLLERGMCNFGLLNIAPGWGDAQIILIR